MRRDDHFLRRAKLRATAPKFHGLATLGGATVISAVSGLIVLILAGRRLGPDAYADFAAVWSLYFLFAGLGAALQQEIVLAVAPARRSQTAGSRPVWGSIWVLLFVTPIAYLTAGPARDFESGDAAAIIFALGVAGLLTYCAVSGLLAAYGYWNWVTFLVLAEGVFRVLVSAPVLSASPNGNALVALIVCGPVVVVVPLLCRSVRGAVAARSGFGTGRFLVRTGKTALTAVAGTAMGAGLPVIVAVTATSDLGADAGALFAALVLTRSPVLLLVNGVRQRMLAILSADPRPGAIGARKAAITASLVTVLGSVVAMFGGPALMEALYGSTFVIQGWSMGLLVVSGVLLAAQTVGGWVLAASGRHGDAAVGWLVSVLVTAATCALPGELTAKVVLAALLGPSFGLALQLSRLAKMYGPRVRPSPHAG